MVYHTVKQIGMSCLRRNVSLAGSPWRRATGGSRRSTITTTVSASTARCAKRTSKDRASSPREVGLSVRCTPASPQQIIYNSDTVYSTTTFRPVSPSPVSLSTSAAPETPSPQRTRKLETPLHFDGGLFSDIRSMEGKLLSKVTVDRVHSSTRHDVTDSPSVYEGFGSHGNKDFVNDIIKTETITNEDVIKVKFTPVPPEIDTPRLLTPSQFQVNRPKTPIEYLKDNFEDLQSYKIVNSLCKEKQFENGGLMLREKSIENLSVTEPFRRSHSPLANLLVPEQLTKIESYLQESLDACSAKVRNSTTPVLIRTEGEIEQESKETVINETYEVKCTTQHLDNSTNSSFKSYHGNENTQIEPVVAKEIPIAAQSTMTSDDEFITKRKSKVNSVHQEKQGVLKAIYNMPIHYHAAIICFILIVYNLIYQYIKQNCHGILK